MSTRPDADRSIAAWLEAQASDRAPDTLLEASRVRIRETRQRRAWWPAWRTPAMNAFAKLAIAAAGVVVVAIVGLNLLPRNGGNVGGGPVITPSPIASPTPSPPLVPSDSPPPALNGTLKAGTYRLAESQFTRRPFTFTVPDGWRRDDGNFISRGPSMDAFEKNGVTMATWIVSHIYADSCQWDGTLEATETAAEVVDALRRQSGHETTGPTATTVGGLPASRFELSLPGDADLTSCDQDFARLWPDAGPNEAYGWPIFAGQTVTVYVVDVGGKAQLIVAGKTEGSSAADVSELQQVIESIRFE